MNYKEFLESKVAVAPQTGFDCGELNANMFPHQQDVTRWSLKGGRRAIFASFGNGKTVIGLELAHKCHEQTKKQSLIICPLGVRHMAVKMGRYGIGIELNADYFRDGLGYLRQADTQLDAPTLFDFIGKEA